LEVSPGHGIDRPFCWPCLSTCRSRAVEVRDEMGDWVRKGCGRRYYYQAGEVDKTKVMKQ